MWFWQDFASNSTEILASIVQAVAVLVVNLRPIRTEVFDRATSSALTSQSEMTTTEV